MPLFTPDAPDERVLSVRIEDWTPADYEKLIGEGYRVKRARARGLLSGLWESVRSS